MIGETISHYRVTAKLGEGGMGEVYLAEDTELGRQVALKVLPAEMADNPERLERFRREAKAVAALNHPNIVTIFSIETAPLEDGEASAEVRFLTMELVEGQSLDKVVPAGGLPLSKVFDIAIPLADALAAAHEKGIVHRDLKPANVMVSDNDRVKVLDFGLAKLTSEPSDLAADDDATRAATSSATLTQEGTVMGTAPYMSPEQLQGKSVDARSDVFSFGIILYELATGQRPFRGDSGIDLASSILRDTPSAVTEARADLPRHLARIVQHCLEKDPRRRFQSALDIRNELDSLRDETKSSSVTSIGGPATLTSGQAPIMSAATEVPSTAPPSSTPAQPTIQPSGSSPGSTVPAESIPGVSSGEIVASRPSKRGLQIGLVAVALMLVALGAWWLRRGSGAEKATDNPPAALAKSRTSVVAAADTPSVAVLPFTDLSAEKDQEYFTDGLTEELINVLTQLDQLRVAGRTSSFQFKERTEDLRDIGQKLNVSTILEGSVRKSGDQVRISAQLVSADDGLNLWSETYDRTLQDIFEVQDDIARSVASALEVTLLGGSEIVSQEADAEAYNLVLRARHFLQQNTVEATDEAMRLLDQALEIDPEYAGAWIDLGLAYVRQGELAQGQSEAREGFQKGLEMLERGLALEPESAVAITRVAGQQMRLDFDFKGAEAEMNRALELGPNDPRVLGNASIVKAQTGHVDEAIELLERSVQIDPLHQTLLLNLGIRYAQADRLEDAEASFERLLQLNPDYTSAHAFLGDVFLLQRRPKAALEKYQMEKNPTVRAVGMARAYNALSDSEASDAALHELLTAYGDSAAYGVAEIHASRGEIDEAFDWLNRAYDQRIWALVNVKVDRSLENLHGDPRWEPFLAKMGLAD